MPSGFDPMGGSRFSERDMRQYINLEHTPILVNRRVLQFPTISESTRFFWGNGTTNRGSAPRSESRAECLRLM
jgi:hypothetical protein